MHRIERHVSTFAGRHKNRRGSRPASDTGPATVMLVPRSHLGDE
ncbi:hypothetical protein HTIA_1459 [Halorhabdus tiamatea SARL4B]|uniref:Uncharacterized protein n=1 Tax=Halorhabdus tiamatea SARL4B TaxID=1033806 RepID=S6D8J7_9EURY|nr:hypothetical protein HTIA_1459 [Halorhabdus tiamatea SARL4B]